MRRTLAFSLSLLSLLAALPASAQEYAPGPRTVEVTIIPAGGTFFTSNGGPDFGNYTYGGALAVHFNRFVGVEGEVGGSLGVTQDLIFGGLTSTLKTPNTVNYSGNVVVHAPLGHGVMPFATGGVGGLTMFERAELGVFSTDTFLTGNVGGGLKWFAPNGRWGLRGDYRFTAVRSKDDASAFFGQENRYGHRVYAGVIVNPVR